MEINPNKVAMELDYEKNSVNYLNNMKNFNTRAEQLQKENKKFYVPSSRDVQSFRYSLYIDR